MATLVIDETNQAFEAAGKMTGAPARRASTTDTMAPSRKRLWAGRILSGMAVLFLSFDGVAKLMKLAAVVEGSAQLGYPASTIFGIGVVLLACVAVYVVPRTSIVGAVLLTGYLGGAIATHVRVGNPLFSHVLFPIYVAALIWGGLYLRDRRVRTLISR
jgi:hypothetical protein